MDGFIGAIARPLAWVLAQLFNVVPSLGMSIIMLTLLINLALFPLMLKQTRASRAFSALQPQIKVLQEKHKDDPQKMQEEVMALQRETGASPLGCLGPMLVQMPIWFGLFRLLREPLVFVPESTSLYDSIAAGNTRFLGMDLVETATQAWSTGFAATIPFALAIMLMIATQYFQQVHSQRGQVQDSSPQAQTMQRITRAMPVFFGVIAVQFQAGVIVYWATSNLFRLLQQVVIFKIDGRPPSPAEREEAAGKQVDEPEPKSAPKKPQGSVKKQNRRRRN